ncbi:MAG: DNA-protecting protein DprA, partial [Candidatus Levybacteria bacterium]|nr:DNA-protecting protein DprA [Candidatus Levybacteria bacterium]
FPSRNRIIAGLSLGVLVTEGAEDSGALITADYALKFNRRVFAVPGPITSSLSKGPYKLIQKGAKLVTNAQDVINELGITGTISTTSITGKRSVRGENKEEQKVLTLLEHEALHFDEIARITGFEPSKLGSILSIMEMKGMVKSLDIGLFSITS